MSIPASRFLLRLDEAIQACSDPVQADCLRAKQVCYLGRQGHFDEARVLLADLRARHDARPRVETSVWLNLAEGMIRLYGGDTAAALDRFKRAHALSAAAAAPALQAVSAAWLAHLAYVRGKVDEMAFHLEVALSRSNADEHFTRSRASLVVAQGLHVAARSDLAKKWYMSARIHALAESDDAALSAMMYNMTGIRVAHLRQARLTGLGPDGQGKLPLASVESVLNYDSLVGVASFGSYLPLLRAQVHSLEGRADLALPLYDEHVREATAHQGQAHLESYLLADRAWCLVDLGRVEEGLAGASQAERCLDLETQPDERAATHSRLAQIHARVGNAELAQRHRGNADEAWRQYVGLQERIVTLLADIDRSYAPDAPDAPDSGSS